MGLRKPDPSKHDGNLTPEVVLKNYYGYSQGEKVEGGIIAPTSSTGLGTPFQSGDNIGLQSAAQENGFHIAKGGTYGLVANKSSFGDATAADVASGKKFTSKEGLNMVGTSTAVDTSDATATAADIASGKTAYVQGAKVKGTLTGIMSVINDIGITRTKEKSIPSGDWTHLYLKTNSSYYGQQVYLIPKNLSSYTLSSSFILTSGTSGVDSFSLSLDTNNQTLQSSVWLDDYFSELKAVKI